MPSFTISISSCDAPTGLFMRLPGGRDTTLAYVARLRSQPPFLRGESGADFLNLMLPQFPVGTEVALVRQAIVINNLGNLVPTSLTESVQLRVYHAITPGPKYMNYINGPSSHDQDFFEFRMSRQQLFTAHDGGLVAVAPSQTEFATFNTHGMDAFNPTNLEGQTSILARCRACHADSGIHSVQSRLRWMKPTPGLGGRGSRNNDPIAWETMVTIRQKEQQREFKLLQSMWWPARD